MGNVKHDLGLRLVKALDALLITVPFGIAWFLFYADRIAYPYYRVGNWGVILLFFALYCVFGRIYDGFAISMSRISEIVYSQGLSVLISHCILYLVTVLLMRRLPNPLPLVGALAAQMLLSILWAVAAHKWYFSTFPPKRSAIIYDTRSGMERLIAEYGLSKKFEVQFTAPVENCLHDLSLLDGMEAVFLSDIHSRDRNVILKHCVREGIDVYMIPRIGDVIMSGAETMHMFHLPVLRAGRYSPDPLYLLTKRLFDIVVSGLTTVILSPVFVVTAVAIKVTDGGPVFYRQERLTKNGKRFYIRKFRSMRVDAEKDGVARLSTGDNDDRITPVGRVIRKIRVDELPQLLDVLQGNLSIVGPRPERPQIAEEYCRELPEFDLRLQAKAGLTGYAQVYGKYNTTPYDKLQMDLMYIAHPSFLEDLRICFATVKILFMPESTEGVSEDQTTAMK